MASPSLHLLASRSAGAAENMAIDYLLLQRYPDASHPRLRHYGWHRPAITFGYSQKFEEVRALCPDSALPLEKCRRFSGGGIVDHQDDWTYALVIPRGHPLEKIRALESYRVIHEALADSLRSLGQAADTKKECEPPTEDSGKTRRSPGLCFSQPECFDVIDPDSGKKIAGAAQKRNKHGLLLQGSLWRPSAPNIRDWDSLLETFAARLGQALETDPCAVPWPDFNEDEQSQLTERYSSSEWNEQR